MANNITEMVFILDRSGSMHGLEKDTIGGFNSMIDRQKQAEGPCYVTTVLFDDRYELVHNRIELSSLSPLTDEDYYTRGSTALLDAVGVTIVNVKSSLRHIREELRPDKVVFVITTDGLENASREYTYSAVRKLITEQKEAGWEFMFLGANIDAVSEAQKFGIAKERAVRYKSDHIGTTLNFKTVGEALMSMRCAGAINEDWAEAICEDTAERGF